MIGFLTRFHYLTRILLNQLCWKIFCKLYSSSGNQSLLSRNTGKRKNLLNENVLLELKSSRRNCMYQNEYRILLTRQQSHVFWCLLWQTLIDSCCLLDRDTQDRRGWHCVQEEDGGEGGDTWVGFEQQNHRQHWSQDRTRLSALLQEMTQIKYFNEKLIDNNWGATLLCS